MLLEKFSGHIAKDSVVLCLLFSSGGDVLLMSIGGGTSKGLGEGEIEIYFEETDVELLQCSDRSSRNRLDRSIEENLNNPLVSLSFLVFDSHSRNILNHCRCSSVPPRRDLDRLLSSVVHPHPSRTRSSDGWMIERRGITDEDQWFESNLCFEFVDQ